MRFHITVRGRVQGVGYRYFVKSAAGRKGIAGWVRNCENGEVECEAQASKSVLADFIVELKTGHAYAQVDAVTSTEVSERAGEKFFEIKY